MAKKDEKRRETVDHHGEEVEVEVVDWNDERLSDTLLYNAERPENVRIASPYGETRVDQASGMLLGAERKDQSPRGIVSAGGSAQGGADGGDVNTGGTRAGA